MNRNTSSISQKHFEDLIRSSRNQIDWLTDNATELDGWQEATTLNSPEAMYLTALCFTHGVVKTQDYMKAYELFERAAKLGNSYALLMLGVFHKSGLGVEQNYEKAFEIYLKAAEAGNAQAMFNVGCLYGKGEGVPADNEKAVFWLLKAGETAEQQALGNLMSNIGYFYYYGDFVPQNYSVAMEWYNKAVEAGSENAILNIGLMYRDGKGVESDHPEALKWLEKGMKLGNKDCMDYYILILLYGGISNSECDEALLRLIHTRFLPDELLNQLNKNINRTDFTVPYTKRKMVRDIFEVAALWGSAEAMVLLGFYHSHISRCEYDEAFKWHQKAAALGNATAMNALANIYEYGWGGKKNPKLEQEWRDKAKAAGMKYCE